MLLFLLLFLSSFLIIAFPIYFHSHHKGIQATAEFLKGYQNPYVISTYTNLVVGINPCLASSLSSI